MTIDIPDEAEWRLKAVEFLRNNLPFEPERGGWNDYASTAYQIGCSALIALGEADPVRWGALKRDTPRTPDVTPRFDDLCVSILWLAHQTNQIAYRCMDGSAPTPTGRRDIMVVRAANAPPPPAPNIKAANGCGPARADDATVETLSSLGLVRNNAWSELAETVHWRSLPSAWAMDFMSDPRFIAAVDHTVATAPDLTAEKIRTQAIVTEHDIDRFLERIETEKAKLREQYGPNIRQSPNPARDRVPRSILFRA